MFSVLPTTRNSSTTHRSRRTTWEKWTVTWFWSCAVACLTVVVVLSRRILNSLISCCRTTDTSFTYWLEAMQNRFGKKEEFCQTLSDGKQGFLRHFLSMILSKARKYWGKDTCKKSFLNATLGRRFTRRIDMRQKLGVANIYLEFPLLFNSTSVWLRRTFSTTANTTNSNTVQLWALQFLL